MNKFPFVLALVALGAAASFSGASAAEYEVQMLNKGSNGMPMQFEPAFLKIAPGDTVKFVPTTKGHNSETILEIAPEGAEPWKAKINEEISVTFSQEGTYAYKCLPHFALGMVGLIQVGDGAAGAQDMMGMKMPPKAKARMAELMGEAGGAAAPAN